MTAHPNSQFIIVPAARWPQLRTWFLAEGFEIGEGVPLGATAEGVVTHRAFHAWITDALKAAIDQRIPAQSETNAEVDRLSQSNKQARWAAIRAGRVAVGTVTI